LFAGYMRSDLADSLAPSWFMCVGIAGLVGLVLMLSLARRRGVESGAVASAVLWSYLAAVIAGIVMPMAIDCIERLIATGHLGLRWAGMTSFWGYLAGALAFVAVCRRDRVSIATMADLAAIPMGFALVFARIGCFMAGCDYGRVTSVPWAMRFPAGSPAWRDQIHAGLIPAGRLESLPVHPTQLYEACLGLVIAAVAWAVSRRTDKPGRVFVAAAATYAIGRLAIETLRGDAGRGIYAGFSSGQIFSLLVLLAIAARHVLVKRAIVVAAPLLVIGLVGSNAYAQPTSDLDLPPPVPNEGPPPVAQEPFEVPLNPQPVIEEYRPLRPIFAFGVLLAGATSANRSGEQVPDLSGMSLSFGYIPGRFGLWLDADHLVSSEAKHDTAIASVSFAPRVTPHLWIGVRAGIGVTDVSFMSSQFASVVAPTFRIDPIAELVVAHNWAVWVRPLTLDVISSEALGGPVTTFQFRAGIAYRFGERR
ncbi:MAG TPA: prolipoprotein diacylglyceryl transferase, partial [Kofleriaceae bacterium]